MQNVSVRWPQAALPCKAQLD